MRPGNPIKQIDRAGRVLIPRQLMDMLGYEIGTPVNVMQGENGDIVIRRNDTRCDVCGHSLGDKHANIGAKKLCMSCCEAAVAALTAKEAGAHGNHTPQP